jgi:hypothetical protein
LWSVVSVVRLPPVGRNTEQQTILFLRRSTGVISRWTGRRVYPTGKPDLTFVDVKNSTGYRKTGQLVELLPNFSVCPGASCYIECSMWRSSVRATPSRVKSTLDGERTDDLASGKLLSGAACGVGLLTEVQEVACLGVYRTQILRHLWTLMRGVCVCVCPHSCLPLNDREGSRVDWASSAELHSLKPVSLFFRRLPEMLLHTWSPGTTAVYPQRERPR